MSRYYNDFLDEHTESLEHHGVLGMKWGVRRYVNEDGSLTAKGRQKYGSNPYKMKNSYRRKQAQMYKNSERHKQAEAAYLDRAHKRVDAYDRDHQGSLRRIQKRNSEAQAAEQRMSEELMKEGTKGFSNVKATQAFKDTQKAYDRVYDESRSYLKNVNRIIDDEFSQYANSELTALGYDTKRVGKEYISAMMMTG